MAFIKWYRSKTAWVIIITAVVAMGSCNKEDVILEPTPMNVTLAPQTHKVNIIVDNQAKGVIFESDSIVLHYLDKGICKSFDTEEYYLKDVVLQGKLYTPTYTIYNGNIRIPIRQGIQDTINNIYVELYDGCPWYSDSGYKVLQSIQFGDPSVEDWIED